MTDIPGLIEKLRDIAANETIAIAASALAAQQATIEELRAILRDCHPAVRLIVNGGNRRRADLDKAEDALTRINAALAKAGDET